MKNDVRVFDCTALSSFLVVPADLLCLFEFDWLKKKDFQSIWEVTEEGLQT